MHLPTIAPLALLSLTLAFAQQHLDQPNAIQNLSISSIESDNIELKQNTETHAPNNKRGFSDRILNGAAANINNFPFTVFLYGDLGNSGKACGGTLLSPNVIVTAAHCLINDGVGLFSPTKFYISAGSAQTLENNSNAYIASQLIVHPKYIGSAAVNDIGVIILAQSIPSSIATPTKIYNQNIADNMPVIAAGWGATNNQNYEISPVLNYVELSVSSSSSCSVLNPDWLGNSNYNICTAVINGKDSCYGDSGGPLVVNVPGLMPLVGLTSTGNAPGNLAKPLCGQPGGVAYYTNVQYFANWISSVSNIPVSQLMYAPKPTSSPTPPNPDKIINTSSATKPKSTAKSTSTKKATSTKQPTSTKKATSIKKSTTTAPKTVKTSAVSKTAKPTSTTSVAKNTKIASTKKVSSATKLSSTNKATKTIEVSSAVSIISTFKVAKNSKGTRTASVKTATRTQTIGIPTPPTPALKTPTGTKIDTSGAFAILLQVLSRLSGQS